MGTCLPINWSTEPLVWPEIFIILNENDMHFHLSGTTCPSTVFTRRISTRWTCSQKHSSRSGLVFHQEECLMSPSFIHTCWMSSSPQPSTLRVKLATMQAWSWKVVVLWKPILTLKWQEKVVGPKSRQLQWHVYKCLQNVWKATKSLCQTRNTHGTTNPLKA